MTSIDLSKEIWDLANAITGFAVVQGLVFAYACAKPEIGDVINHRSVKFAIAVMVAVIGIAQCLAVYWCRVKLCGLDPDHCSLHEQAGLGRILCIAGILVFSILMLYARQLFAGRPFNSLGRVTPSRDGKGDLSGARNRY